jgi:hypothetical protein
MHEFGQTNLFHLGADLHLGGRFPKTGPGSPGPFLLPKPAALTQPIVGMAGLAGRRDLVQSAIHIARGFRPPG